MVFARSAAMTFNRLADQRIDAANPRTAVRHLPAGQITPVAAWIFLVICAVGFVGSAAVFILSSNNWWPLYLAVPVLSFLFGYSFSKRFTILSHFWLGASLLMAPVAAWIAIRGLADLTQPLLLGFAVLLWVAGFDIIYACQDVDFDRGAKLRSVPARFGVRYAMRIAAGCHLGMVTLLIVLGWASPV